MASDQVHGGLPKTVTTFDQNPQMALQTSVGGTNRWPSYSPLSTFVQQQQCSMKVGAVNFIGSVFEQFYDIAGLLWLNMPDFMDNY